MKNTNPTNLDFSKALSAIETKMSEAGCSATAFKAFSNSFQKLAHGDTGMIMEDEISSVPRVPKLEELADYKNAGNQALDKTVVINLNGGLGTSMGLNKAKSLLPVKNNLSFLEIIAHQLLHLRKQRNASIPLLLMNSFRTLEDSLAVLSSIEGLENGQDQIPFSFTQNKVPKLNQKNLMAAEFPANIDAEWCPPGHGDIYCCLYDTGILQHLLKNGYRYAFISNADNLGAVFDPCIAGYVADKNIPFLMEVARRTPADKKGGHLALKDSSLLLRESAQCPQEAIAEFENIEKYSYFNTNSLWINLEALDRALKTHGGFLDLPLIKNPKNINPSDAKSEPVYQLETAMGAAISVFEGAAALHVPRSRFVPIKTTNDLLELWSDNFELTAEYNIERQVLRDPVNINLDPKFYRNLSDFQSRFPNGAPDLSSCDGLEVIGDVCFGANVKLDGTVKIINSSGSQKTIGDGLKLSGEIQL